MLNILAQYGRRGDGASGIVTSVETAIREGRLAAGSALPTVRDLARQLRVSPTTVAAAYRTLRARGLVHAQGRRGTRVSPRPPLPIRAVAPAPSHLRDVSLGNPDPALLPSLQLLALSGGDAARTAKDELFRIAAPIGAMPDARVVPAVRKHVTKERGAAVSIWPASFCAAASARPAVSCLKASVSVASGTA